MSDPSTDTSEFEFTTLPKVGDAERGRLLATIALALVIVGCLLSAVQVVLTINLADSSAIGVFAAILIIASIVVGNVAIHQTQRGMPGHARAVTATVIGYVSAFLLVIVPILVSIGVFVMITLGVIAFFVFISATYGQLGR